MYVKLIIVRIWAQSPHLGPRTTPISGTDTADNPNIEGNITKAEVRIIFLYALPSLISSSCIFAKDAKVTLVNIIVRFEDGKDAQ